MARAQGADPVYAVAETFRERCLIQGRSLLWGDMDVWTMAELDALWAAFVDRPDTGGRKFFEKLHDQLADQPEDIHRLATDLLAFYLLAPTNIKAGNKLKSLETVAGWKLSSNPPDYSVVAAAFQTGFCNPGPFYLIHQYAQLSFFLAFGRAARQGQVNPLDPLDSRRVADGIAREIKNTKAGRHVLLHLLFPDAYERIASDHDKQLIFNAFRELAGNAEDIDDALFSIRKALSQRFGRSDIDFYTDHEIRSNWDQERKTRALHYWVEKTLVRGHPDREGGDFACGQVLWSPQRDKAGKDIYRFMREVQPGDIIFHLTDNEAFIGLSRASTTATEFGGVPNSEWGEGPSYLVGLKEFTPLNPPLSRGAFFASPFRERLTGLLDAGERNLFYNREPALNQGAYLTPAPPELVAILEDAYRGSSRKSLADFIPKSARS